MMKRTYYYLLILLVSYQPLTAQNWNYPGDTCCLHGYQSSDIETAIKSNGNLVTVTFNASNAVRVQEYNGINWTSSTLLNYPGFISKIDMEMFDDTAYVAVMGSYCKVYTYTGSVWEQLGDSVPGSLNADFVIDRNGVPYVATVGGSTKLYNKTGPNWTLVHTFPVGSFPDIYAYAMAEDNTMLFDSANVLHYVVSVNSKHLVQNFDGTSHAVTGDTIYNGPYNGATTLFIDNEDNLYYSANSSTSKSYVKKLTGTNWILHGDTATLPNNTSNFAKLAFDNSNTMYFTSIASRNKVYYTSGGNNPFVVMDTINNIGTLCQPTDLDIDPNTNKIYASFNDVLPSLLGTGSVMVHDLSGTSSITKDDLPEKFSIYPNPSFGYLQLEGSFSYQGEASIQILNLLGACVFNDHTWVDQYLLYKKQLHLAPGVYLINLTFKNKTLTQKWIVQ